MRAWQRVILLGLVLAGGVSFSAPDLAAQDFYRNKQIRLIVGHPVGNDHDVGGRLLARYLGRHIPGRPSVIVQNMTAAASVAAANYVYAQAPRRDGHVSVAGESFAGFAFGRPDHYGRVVHSHRPRE